MTTTTSAARVGDRHGRHLWRAAVAAGALTAGVLGAARVSISALTKQAHEASDAIVSAASGAAQEQGEARGDSGFWWQALPPSGDGVYLPQSATPRRTGPHGTLVLAVMGDSTSVGYGCRATADLPGVRLAIAAADGLGRPVRLHTRGSVGAISADLDGQLLRVLADAPDAVAIMIGANDVRHRIPIRRAARQLGGVVAALRAHGIAVVVGTCPDLGAIAPIPQPLRRIAGVLSRRLARAQGHVVSRLGGVAVALDRLVSPDFYGHPELFYVDGFHPSSLGYARATAALAPEVTEALRG